MFRQERSATSRSDRWHPHWERRYRELLRWARQLGEQQQRELQRQELENRKRKHRKRQLRERQHREHHSKDHHLHENPSLGEKASKLEKRTMRDGGLGRLQKRVMGRLGESLHPDDAYLSYYDIRLTREDMQTLKNDWLTDNVISFWEEYLEREHLSRFKNSNIVLLRPSMSFMLLQTPDPRTLREALPNFTRTTHVFLPINDCHNANEAEGGTHWSLLLISIVDGIAFHYDSLPPGNRWEAYQVTMKFSTLLNRPIRFINLDDSPVQENSSDCGVFVCLSMRHLLMNRLLKANSNEKVSMSLAGKKIDASAGRKEITKIIEGFRKEGERRRSGSASPAGKKSRSPPRIE